MTSSCSFCNQKEEKQLNYQELLYKTKPLSFKYNLLHSIGLTEKILKWWIQPNKKLVYNFQRSCLLFLSNEISSIPLIFFPGLIKPEQSLLIIYSHGSGSTLNNIYNYGKQLSYMFSCAFIGYDYTGDGESQKQFQSFQNDIKIVLAWAIRKGYNLKRIILCGFSLGSYSALLLKGSMSRILISPICGIIAYAQGQIGRYEHEKYDNIEKSLNIRSSCLIFHCFKQMIPLSHSKLLKMALQINNQNSVKLYQITDEQFEHRNSPFFIFTKQGKMVLNIFLDQVQSQSSNYYLSQNFACAVLFNSLNDIQYITCYYNNKQYSLIDHFKQEM